MSKKYGIGLGEREGSCEDRPKALCHPSIRASYILFICNVCIGHYKVLEINKHNHFAAWQRTSCDMFP